MQPSTRPEKYRRFKKIILEWKMLKYDANQKGDLEKVTHLTK